MAVIKSQIRSGVYYDSAFLMQLQRDLAALPGALDAGVVMGTETNKELLARVDLLTKEAAASKPDDLIIAVKAEDAKTAEELIGKLDELLTRKKSTIDQKYRPQSVEKAIEMQPESSWVLVSVAGRYAAGVTRDALRRGRHVFLFSDNVSVEEEIEVKKMAAERGLLVMGPDCGTAIIRGMGLGFANKCRFGSIGIVAAAGTGLQQVSSRIHQLGGGVSYGIGTGGRDLSEKIGAMTFLQALDALARDPDTKVIVLVSKPPAPKVAEKVLRFARKAGKPVVVNFIGRAPTAWRLENLHFAMGLDDAARLAVDLANSDAKVEKPEDLKLNRFKVGQRYLRGLYSGGTLAYEAQYILQSYLPVVWANAPINKEFKMKDALVSEEHSIIDLGEDEFTVGRLHPMMDNELRIRRLIEEANDPSVAVIMLDVVIGYGSHMNPASELAPAVAKAKEIAKKDGRYLEVVAVVTGTDEDPQNMNDQIRMLKEAGAIVDTNNENVVRYAGRLLQALNSKEEELPSIGTPVDLATLQKPLEAINVGLESFASNLVAQNVPTVHVDWRPVAGGNEKLASILERMKQK